MDADQVGGAWGDCGDLLDGGWALRDGALVGWSRFHEILVNCGNGDSDGSSKLESSHLVPSSSANDTAAAHTPSGLGYLKSTNGLLLSSFNQTPAIENAGAGTSGDNAAFSIRVKSGTFAENEDLIPHASVHVNLNDNSTGVELVVRLPIVEQEDFTAVDQTVESKAFKKYFATSDSVQHSRCCVENFDAMPVAATGEGANCTLEEVDELITTDYYSDV